MPIGSSLPALSIRQRWWQWFLLEPVENRVCRYSVEQSRNIRELFDAAVLRDEAARQMLDRDHLGLAVELARSAASLYVRGVLASRLSPVELANLTTSDAWERFDRLRESGELLPAPGDFEGVRAVLSDIDPDSWNGLRVEEGLLRAQSLAPALGWLRALIEPRSLAAVRYQRWRRIGAVAAASLALLGWGSYCALAPRNLALHQEVQVSSIHPYSTAPADGLVDGTIDQTYGVHTNVGEKPWVMVDLGRSQAIGRIKIYNRGDGWFDDCLPLILELSQDATDFEEVDRRTTTFSRNSPWVFVAPGKSARYIRVRGKPGGFVALGELEAYAK